MARHLWTTRPMPWRYNGHHQPVIITHGHPARPGTGGALVMAPLPGGPIGAGGMPFSGMDPSDPLTHVRRWNPQPGMVARFNFDGAQVQGETDMGGTWNRPARRKTRAAVRPRRRPR
jgi:hypothetical protein